MITAFFYYLIQNVKPLFTSPSWVSFYRNTRRNFSSENLAKNKLQFSPRFYVSCKIKTRVLWNGLRESLWWYLQIVFIITQWSFVTHSWRQALNKMCLFLKSLKAENSLYYNVLLLKISQGVEIHKPSQLHFKFTWKTLKITKDCRLSSQTDVCCVWQLVWI